MTTGVLICGLFLITIITAGGSITITEKHQETLTKCSHKTGTTSDQVMDFFKEGTLKGATHEVMCFMKCFGEETGVIEGGKIQTEKMFDWMSKEGEPITDDCKKEAEGAEINECEDLMKIAACMEFHIEKS